MNVTKLTNDEAIKIFKMLKASLAKTINFPSKGKGEEFQVIGDTPKDIFIIKIFRGKINANKYNLGARIKKDGIVILELHINPSNIHINPDGSKITGSHWHVYSEEHGLHTAIPSAELNDEEFVNNSISFFKKFNIIKMPEVHFQLELK